MGESYKRKGAVYVRKMPRKRLLTTLLNFDVAVLVFVVLGLLLGSTLSIRQILLSLVGWESVGNSNWYIFVILLCYLETYVVLLFGGRTPAQHVFLLFSLCLVSIVILSIFKDSYWHDTLLCYPLGFAFSAFKDRIECSMKRHYWTWLILIAMIFIVFYIAPHGLFSLSFNAASMAFSLLIVLITMRVSIGNTYLGWIGKNLFPIYIYMRLPMILMECTTPDLLGYPVLFILISLLITLVIAYYYHFWQIRLE